MPDVSSSRLVLAGHYDHCLVALSIVIAIFASYTALDLAGRVTSARGRIRVAWLTGGAVAMGLASGPCTTWGCWPSTCRYWWNMTGRRCCCRCWLRFSFPPVALFVVSRAAMGLSRAVVGSLFMGGGIAAMRLPALCHFSVAVVTVSLILAVVISYVALWLAFYFRGETREWGWRKILSAVVMGLAIPLMHYTGMAAASFSASPPDHSMAHSVSISAVGTAGIVIVTLMILALALLTSLVDAFIGVTAPRYWSP